MKTKEEIMAEIGSVEAGYVFDPDDLGGETNHGITKRVAERHRDAWDKFGWDGDMKTMPVEFSYYVNQKDYWDVMKLDGVYELSHTLAERMLDFGFNAGTSTAVEALQRLLNVHNHGGKSWANIVADGKMGPASLRALKAYFDINNDDGDLKLTGLLLSMQDYHYIDISEARAEEVNEKFTNGWTNRTWNAKKAFFKEIL